MAAQTSNMAAIPNPSREADRVGASAIVRLGLGPPATEVIDVVLDPPSPSSRNDVKGETPDRACHVSDLRLASLIRSWRCARTELFTVRLP